MTENPPEVPHEVDPYTDLPEIVNQHAAELSPERREGLIHALTAYILSDYINVDEAADIVHRGRLAELADFKRAFHWTRHHDAVHGYANSRTDMWKKVKQSKEE